MRKGAAMRGKVLIYEGGCQCGAVRFAIRGDPLVAYCCHCTDCQQQSSSAFGMSVWFAADAFAVTSGTPVIWTARADSGCAKPCAFCPDCGTRLYHGDASGAGTLSVKGGALDDIGHIAPAGHLWTKSALPWVLVRIDGDLQYATEPDDFEELVARFSGKIT